MAMFYRHSRDPFQKETPNYPILKVANRFQPVFPEPKNLESTRNVNMFSYSMIHGLQKTSACSSCNGAK